MKQKARERVWGLIFAVIIFVLIKPMQFFSHKKSKTHLSLSINVQSSNLYQRMCASDNWISSITLSLFKISIMWLCVAIACNAYRFRCLFCRSQNWLLFAAVASRTQYSEYDMRPPPDAQMTMCSHCFAVNCGKLHQIVRMCTINNHHVSCRNVKRNCIDYNVHFHFHLQCASHSVVVVMCLQCVSRQTMTPSNLSPFHSRRNLCRSKCIRQYRNALVFLI